MEKCISRTKGSSTILLIQVLPLLRGMLPARRWREDGKFGSGNILDWRSWQVLPSRYVMFQGTASAADQEHGELPRIFLQVLQHCHKTFWLPTPVGARMQS